MKKHHKIEITKAGLQILAMVTMLCDHLWGTIVPGNDWLTCIGRLTLPIYAFLIVEGYFHTHNLRKYIGRLFLFAVISEIPFNLALGSRLFYPVHQNVLWSFLISILLIHMNERVKKKTFFARLAVGAASILLAYILGLLTMVDYHHAGPLTVLVFYFFRKRKWWCLAAQLICLWYINFELLAGLQYEWFIFGERILFTRQGLALLALIPIWLYKGKLGYHSKPFQYFCYAFYPLHLLILGLAKLF